MAGCDAERDAERDADATGRLMRAESGDVPRGFALPLALAIVLAVALVEVLLIDGALARARGASSAAAETAAAAAAESALALGLALRLDSSAIRQPAGTTLASWSSPAPDSTWLTVRVMQPGIARVAAKASVMRAGLRAIAGRSAYVEIELDPAFPGEAALRPLPRLWWVGAR